ncbi:MAG: DUF2089 family protein [Myxococcota bacterium]
MSDPRLPARCPSCQGDLVVVRLECDACGTAVDGRYAPCPVCRLDDALRTLFEQFLDARGNLKEVQRTLGVSYPTERQRIDVMFRELGRGAGPAQSPRDVLRRLRAGEIDVDQAERLLRRD